MLQSNMLQNNESRAQLDRAEGGGIGEFVNFALGFLRRQYSVIIFTAALAVATSVIYLRITPPTYTAQVQILSENPKAQFLQQQSLLAEPGGGTAQIETQLLILKSQAIAISVINQLKLTDDPDFNGSGRPLQRLWRGVRGWFGKQPADPQAAPEDRQLDGVIAAFEARLSAARVSISNVIEISFSSSSAVRAAEIANAVANAYITDQLNAKFEANRRAIAWLQDRLRELGQQASTAERAVNTFKAQNNIVSSGGKPIDEQQVTELNSRLVAVRAQESDTLARLNQFETILRSNSVDSSSSSIGTLDASGSDALSNPIINKLREQYLELTRRESEWSPRFGSQHLAVVNIRSRMQDIRKSILDEVHRLAESTRSDFEVAKQRRQDIEKQLAEAVSLSRATNSAELTMRDLEGSAKGYRSLYDTFLQRYMGSVQQESFPIAEARVISAASPPQSKSKPKTALILVLGILGGVALGVGLGLLRDAMDSVFRTSAEIEAALRLPCLSLVPLLQKPAPGPSQPDKPPSQRAISTRSGIYWAVIGMPLSRFAEAIRSIKLAIDLNPTKTSNKVVGITSSLPNEGKSTIAASLAQLIGHSGKSVIIVDCDLRNPSLSASLAPNATAGIIEVISGARSLEETVWRDPSTNLIFLPVVRSAPLLHTSEILSAEQTRKLFDKLRAMYDYIIVDLPPLTPVVDVRATTALVDCFILVVEWGRTKIDVVQHALHTAPNVYENLIGTVLNKTDIKAMGRYDKSDYYSNEHYTRYGFEDHT